MLCFLNRKSREGTGDMKKIGIGAILVILLALAFVWTSLNDKFTVQPPNYPLIRNSVWLDQHWTEEQREWFHHADQGTRTFFIPYEWFIALERPELSLTSSGLLADPLYLDRYGFISENSQSGPPELPIGFAHGGPIRDINGAPWRNPQSGKDMTSLGLTCAACHTGRFTYQNTSVLIDGAPALTNLGEFQNGVGISLFLTKWSFLQFDRFADRVLGPGASGAAKSQLREQLDQVLSKYGAIHANDEKVKDQTVEEGFARLDALNRIGNTVFAVDLNNSENYVAYSAPVHYPRIWDSSWFTWVQYNGSIEQPMTRNAGEALGVNAEVNLAPGKDQFTSSVNLKTIFELEQLLAGKQPDARTGFNGLTSPKWPSNVLPPINTDLAAKGEVLYENHCQGCHLPAVTKSEFWSSPQWTSPNFAGERYLDLKQLPIQEIGTDASEAQGMKERQVATPSGLGITSNNFGTALGQVVALTVKRWYDDQQPPTPGVVRQQMNGNRDNGVRALLSYKVRPLNGIWATPPYLHNGSVPNLYALLSPVAERPKTFYLGNREYDPVNVGYHTEKFPGGFELDTSIKGNSNSGHEFNNGSGKGIIGPLLTPDERQALTEYLKTL